MAVNVSHTYSLGKKCQKNNLLYKLIIFPNGTACIEKALLFLFTTTA